jgi:hypothetical protein
MAKVRVAGTISLPKNGYKSFINLWEIYDLPKTGIEAKRLWKVWTTALPTDITEGSWIEVEGDFSISVDKDMEGGIRTYQDKNGNNITAHSISIQDPTILQVKMKDNSAAEGVDLDDARKYGQGQNRDLMEQPF